MLRIWHRQTYEQIAQVLEISPNTVAGRYRYGIQKLKRCLKGSHYEQHRTGELALAELEAPAAFGGT